MGHCGAEHPQRAMEYRRPPRHMPRAYQSQRPAVIFLHSGSQVAGSTSPSSAPSSADAATTISAGAIFSLPDSLSANNSATQPRLVSFSLTKQPLGWDPAETNSPSHNTSHRTRIRSPGHPGPKLYIGRESDLQATQGQSFTSDENPIFRPPRAKASHRTRIRSSGHPGPKLHIGRESYLQATQGQSFTSDENPIFRPPRPKALHRTRIRSSGHPGPKLHIGRESDLQATQGQNFTSDRIDRMKHK